MGNFIPEVSLSYRESQSRMASTRSKSTVMYGADELDHLFEVIFRGPRGDEVLVNARKTDSSLKKIKTLDDFLLDICDNLDVVNGLKYRTNSADASTEVDLPDDYKRILIAVPSYVAWLQTNYATFTHPVPFIQKANFLSYMFFRRETKGKEYLYDEIKARESEKFHMLAPATNGNTAGDNTGGSSTSYTKLPVDEPKLANRESQSKMANHQLHNCPVVGSDDLNRIISGFVPQQNTVLTREMAYRTQDSDSHKKPIKIFDMPLQVRSDPNVVNAFRWRKTEQAITLFGYYFIMQYDGIPPPSSHFVCDHIAKSLQSFNLSVHPKLSVFFNGYNVLLRLLGLPVSVTHSTILSSSSYFGLILTVNGETINCVGSPHKLDMQLFIHSAAKVFEDYMLSLFVDMGDSTASYYDVSTDTTTRCVRRIYATIAVEGDEVNLFDAILSSHLPAWTSCVLHYVSAASDVTMCTTSSYTITLASYQDFLDIVLHSLSMHYLHCYHCACYNDGGDPSSCTQLTLMILGHNLCRVGSVYFLQTHDRSLMQTYDGLFMCLFIKSLIMQISKKIVISVLSCHVNLSTHNKSLVQFTTGTSATILMVTLYDMVDMIGCSLALKCAMVMVRQICLYCNCFVGIDNVSAIYYDGNISSLRMVTKYGELVSSSVKPKDYGQHNACVRCVVVSRKYGEYTVCSIDTQHHLRREIALQTGFFVLIVYLDTIPTVNHSSVRKQIGCHSITVGMHRSSCNYKSNRDMLQSDTVLNQPYGASTRFSTCTNGDASSTTPATREVTHVLPSAEFPGLLVRRFDEFHPETRKVALMSHIIGGINDQLVSVYTDNSVLTHVTKGHIEGGKRGAYSWEEEWGEYICKEESSLQVSLRRVALALLVGCWFVTKCVPTWRDVVSYICKTLYDGRYTDSTVDSAVNTMAPTTYEILCDVSCIDVKTYVDAKSCNSSCECFLWCALGDFLEILCNRMDMLMYRYIMKCTKFMLGKRRSHTSLSTDLDTSFGNALLALHLAFSHGRLFYPARSTSQRCIFSTASSSKILLQRATLLVGNNISSAFYGTTRPYWRVRKLLQALACWFTTICNTTIIVLNYGEHIIAASIGYVSVVYDLLLALFKFILYYRNNRFDFTRIDRWGVSHNSEIGGQMPVLFSGLCKNGSIRYVELLVRTHMRFLYDRVYGGISTEMTTLSSFTNQTI